MKKNNETTGKRYVVTYKNENLYLSVFTQHKEIFLSARDSENGKTLAELEAIGRLSSAVWQHAGIGVLIDQLQKSTLAGNDLPGLILAKLEESHV